jgi:hypothetical protein
MAMPEAAGNAEHIMKEIVGQVSTGTHVIRAKSGEKA